MRLLFFAYRDWAINIFNRCKNDDDEFILVSNKKSCNKDFIDSISPDIIFFYGWSWIVPNEIIDDYLCLCLHPSKLPKFRGGSPIQNQIINNVKTSAVTIFKMTDKLDAGTIYFQKDFDMSGYLPEILNKIEELGVEGTLDIINNDFHSYEQNENDATFYKRLKPSNSEIKPEDFDKYDAEYFYNKVRSLQKPYPECYIKCKSGKIIIKNIDYEE